MAAKDFIVAIELGSSKAVGVAGKKNLDGSISVLAVVKEDSSSFIRKGCVYNINQTVQCISNIVKKLSTALKSEIAQVYVGVGGQSIHGIKNVIVKDLPGDTVVSQDIVNELMDFNRGMSYQDQEILDAVPQEYKVDNQLQVSPVGIQCNKLEAHFLNILWRKTFYRKLNNCFDEAGVQIADMFLAPLALADNVLTDAEKRSGCVLVDLGADTTTVSVYYKNILRHLSVIPLGGSNITRDITSLQVDDATAERLKLDYACANGENQESGNQQVRIDADRSIEMSKFAEIVEARLLEIIENVWEQVPPEYVDRLLGGIILTGGGSNMKGIDKAFVSHTHIDKVRIAKYVRTTVTSGNAEVTAHNGMMNTVLSLLSKGEMNCAGEQVPDNVDLFTENTRPVGKPVEQQQPQQGEMGQGVVQPVNKPLRDAEAEQRRKMAEKAAIKDAGTDVQDGENDGNKEEGKVLKNVWSKTKTFIKSLVADE